MRKALPAALVAIPLLYYFGLLAGAAAYPGYSHVTNYASELGSAEAPNPQLFNLSLILAGIAALAAAAMLPTGLARLGGSRGWSIAAAVALAMFGASMVMGGLFPMPDDRHGAFGLGLAAPLVPLFVLLAIRRVDGSGGLRVFLAAVFVASLIMLLIMFGVGGLVTRENVGLYQRLNSLMAFPWLAVLGLWLWRRASAAGTATA